MKKKEKVKMEKVKVKVKVINKPYQENSFTPLPMSKL